MDDIFLTELRQGKQSTTKKRRPEPLTRAGGGRHPSIKTARNSHTRRVTQTKTARRAPLSRISARAHPFPFVPMKRLSHSSSTSHDTSGYPQLSSANSIRKLYHSRTPLQHTELPACRDAFCHDGDSCWSSTSALTVSIPGTRAIGGKRPRPSLSQTHGCPTS